MAHPRPSMVLRRWLLATALLAAAAVTSSTAQAAATLRVSPAMAASGSTVHLTIYATLPGYQQETTVLEVKDPAGAVTYPVQNLKVTGQRVDADVTLSKDGLPAGPGRATVRLCVLTCQDDQAAETGSLLVAAPRPVFGSVSRPFLGHGSTTLAVYGERFTAGTTPTFLGDDVTFTVTSRTPTAIVGTATAEVTSRGPRTLRLASSDGTYVDCPACVRVADYDLSSISPAALTNADGEQLLTVTDAVIPDGPATVTLTPADPVPDQPLVEASNVVTDGRWAGPVDLTAAAPGRYQVALLSSTDQLFVASSPLTVANIGPARLDRLAPAQLAAGARLPVTLTGANFARGATVTVVPADGITVGTSTFRSRTAITVPLAVSAQAAVGPRDVLVQNIGDPAPALCRQCLTIAPPPRLDTVTPRELARGATAAMTVTGAELRRDSQFDLGPDITVTVTDVQTGADRQVAQLSVAVDDSAAPGPRTLRMVNRDGGTATAATPVTVKKPTRLSSDPAKAVQTGSGSTSVALHLTDRATGAAIGGARLSWTLTPVGGGPASSGTQRTDGEGTAVLPLSARQHSTLRVSFDGAADLMPATVAVPVVVRPVLTVTSPAMSSSTTAGAVQLRGTMQPAVAGALVELWVRPPGTTRYTRTATVRTDQRSAFTISLATARRGTYTLYLRTPATPTLLDATSPVLRVVRR